MTARQRASVAIVMVTLVGLAGVPGDAECQTVDIRVDQSRIAVSYTGSLAEMGDIVRVAGLEALHVEVLEETTMSVVSEITRVLKPWRVSFEAPVEPTPAASAIVMLGDGSYELTVQPQHQTDLRSILVAVKPSDARIAIGGSTRAWRVERLVALLESIGIKQVNVLVGSEE